jgi:hypothetical protein
MLSIIVVLILLSLGHGFYLNMRSNNFPKKVKSTEYDYEIPKWAKQRFKKNVIPKFSQYRKQIKKTKPDNYISEEEAHYNAIKVCKLPFGLVQK